MVTSYTYNGNTYYFYYDNNDNYIRIVKQAADMSETEKTIRVHNSSEYVVKLNKKSISAIGAAFGLFQFISAAIDQNFMTSYVNMIIKAFF